MGSTKAKCRPLNSLLHRFDSKSAGFCCRLKLRRLQRRFPLSWQENAIFSTLFLRLAKRSSVTRATENQAVGLSAIAIARFRQPVAVFVIILGSNFAQCLRMNLPLAYWNHMCRIQNYLDALIYTYIVIISLT